MRPIRFCFITTFYPPRSFGGDGIAVQRLARALAKRGHEVTVLYDGDAFRLLADGSIPEDARTGEGPRAATGAGDRVRVVELRSRLGALGTVLTHQTGRPVAHGSRIRSILADGDFDVVNFHNVSLVGAGILTGAGDAISLYTAHEHWLVCPTHALWRYDGQPCPGRRCIRCQIAHRRPPQLHRLTGYLETQLEGVDRFIALSEFSRLKHAEFGFPRPMEVMPPFLEATGSVTPRDETPPHPRPYVLFAGRLVRIKGLDDVIPAFGEIDGLDLVVVGEGEHGDHLRGLGAPLANVRFVGRIRADEMDRWYRHALAVVAPSECWETFGLTVIEGFRQGTPAVARRRGPYPETVESTGGGLLFGNRKELLDALRALRDDLALRAELGARARRAFVERWSEDAVVPRYLDLVLEVAAEKGHRLAMAGTAPHVREVS